MNSKRNLMKERNSNCSQTAVGKHGERGISIVEMLIVVLMIAVVTAFAVSQIAGAQRAMRLSNSAREFTSWLEKARLDSIRRHATTPVSAGEPDLRASVTIASANSYTITIDQNGDGTLDPPRTITIPATHGAAFTGVAVPSTIYYNWRGRPVNNTGTLIELAFTLADGSGNSNPINLKSTGDTSVEANVNTTNVSVTPLSNTANIKSSANIK
jgi:Tfp pilus assembly protein FimT